MHAPGIPLPPLEQMTPEQSRYLRQQINAELKGETDFRIALAKASRGGL